MLEELFRRVPVPHGLFLRVDRNVASLWAWRRSAKDDGSSGRRPRKLMWTVMSTLTGNALYNVECQ